MTLNLDMTSHLGQEYLILLREQKNLHNIYGHPRANIFSAPYTSPLVGLWFRHKTSDGPIQTAIPILKIRQLCQKECLYFQDPRGSCLLEEENLFPLLKLHF